MIGFRPRTTFRIVVACAAAAALSVSCGNWPRVSGPVRQFAASVAPRIDALRSDADIPALSIVVATRAGIAWADGFGTFSPAGAATSANSANSANAHGTSNKERHPRNLRVTSHTPFFAASLGKPIFAYAVLRYASLGKLDLDRPVYEYWSDPNLSPDPRNRTVTAAMLLSHRAGLPNVRDENGLSFSLNPGAAFLYSSEGYLYLQRIIEHFSNMSADSFVRQYVFLPLGMHDSAYRWDDRFEGRVPSGTDGLDHPVPLDRGNKSNVSGGLITSASDYGRFLVALLNGWGLSPQIRARMFSPAATISAVQGSKSAPAWTLAWGTGLGLQVVDGQGTSFWQWGDLDFYKAFMTGNLDDGVALAYFTNSVHGLSVVDELVSATVGGTMPALDWLGYDQVADVVATRGQK